MEARSVTPLHPDEESLWRALTQILVVMWRTIEVEVERETGTSGSAYLVLMHLSEAPANRLRLADLAGRCDLSPSRISRLVDQLVAEGLVAKERSTCDARSWVATLTRSGRDRLTEVYPAVLAGVRSHVFDHLEPEEVQVVGPALIRMASHLGPQSSCPVATLRPGRPLSGRTADPTDPTDRPTNRPTQLLGSTHDTNQ